MFSVGKSSSTVSVPPASSEKYCSGVNNNVSEVPPHSNMREALAASKAHIHFLFPISQALCDSVFSIGPQLATQQVSVVHPADTWQVARTCTSGSHTDPVASFLPDPQSRRPPTLPSSPLPPGLLPTTEA